MPTGWEHVRAGQPGYATDAGSPHRAVVGAPPLAVATTGAAAHGAPRLPASRSLRVGAAERPSAAVWPGTPTDSAAHYLHAARVQRRTGVPLVAAGIAAVTVAFVQFARSGRLGMSDSQAATFTAGAPSFAVGGSWWRASRESDAQARRWSAAQVAAQH